MEDNAAAGRQSPPLCPPRRLSCQRSPRVCALRRASQRFEGLVGDGHAFGRAADGVDRIFGIAYATAMACIILQLPNNYLPIMQK